MMVTMVASTSMINENASAACSHFMCHLRSEWRLFELCLIRGAGEYLDGRPAGTVWVDSVDQAGKAIDLTGRVQRPVTEVFHVSRPLMLCAPRLIARICDSSQRHTVGGRAR